MAYKLIVKTLAEQDITEAVEWYAEQAVHLAGELIDDIEDGIASVKKHPGQYQKRYGEIRVAFIRKFPYGIYYTVEEQTIFMHALLHTSRDPEAGTGRL